MKKVLMINNLKKIFNVASAVLFGSMILWNCESAADNLGSQFFQEDAAQQNILSRDVIAYNINNNDTIRTDVRTSYYGTVTDSVTLGAFSEGVFGMQKTSYVSQVRLSTYDPDFGTNPVADSAVLVIKPRYATDSIKTTTDENYIYPDGSVAAKKVVNTYPIIYKYGKTKLNSGKTKLTINVNEVDEFLGSSSEKIFSNKNVATGTLLGSKTFNGDVSSIKITKDADNSEIFSRDANIRIPLDATFFQNKIIAKKGSFELKDVASFIRYFKGIKISVAENDGYIFKFTPNSVELSLYYKNDLVTNGVTTRPQSVYTFDLGTSNTRFAQINYDRTGTPYRTAMATAYPTPAPTSGTQPTSAEKLYVQGMGGAGFGIKIPDSTISKIRGLYNNQKIGIISAKIRLYTDATSWTGNYAKPKNFVVKQRDTNTNTDLNSFLTDISSLAYTGYTLVKTYDLYKNPAYYDIGITQTLKNIIEKEETNKDFIVNVGQYLYNTQGTALLGSYFTDSQNYNKRFNTPNRVVLVGTDAANPKRAQLQIIYGKK